MPPDDFSIRFFTDITILGIFSQYSIFVAHRSKTEQLEGHYEHLEQPSFSTLCRGLLFIGEQAGSNTGLGSRNAIGANSIRRICSAFPNLGNEKNHFVFLKSGYVFVLYVGEDQDRVDLLTGALGEQSAGQQV